MHKPWLLFVYGTLMRGECRDRVLAGEQFLREAWTTPRYRLLDLGGYPGLVRGDSGGQTVRGELYAMGDELRAELDAIEGVPTLYRLQDVEVEGENRRVTSYFFQQATGREPAIPSGDWRSRHAPDE